MNDNPVIALIILVCHALGAVSCIHAVMTVRTSQGAIAWAVSLLIDPAEAESKPWWFRFAVQLARLTAPIQ